MNQQDRDKKTYLLAKEYLLSLNVPGVSEALLKKYLQPRTSIGDFNSLSDIYSGLLASAQNANMKTGVIGKAIGGVDKLGMVLGDFNPAHVVEEYPDWQSVLKKIQTTLKPKGQVRLTNRSIWPKYCQTILSAARFLNRFPTAEDFYGWASFFDKDERARPALPMLLSEEIAGFGFALACDFLKELGYVNFGKPDVHIRDIFVALELYLGRADDYQLFKAIVRVANNAGVTPYNADKVFWLIGSGDFYLDPSIGNGGRIGRRKAEFIGFAQKTLKESIV